MGGRPQRAGPNGRDQEEIHTVEPLESVQKDGKTVVTNHLTGNFSGSPVNLEFVFGLEGNKIASLEIRG